MINRHRLQSRLLTNHILVNFEKGDDTYVSFYDLTKAFDCVSHTVLINKLHCYNFSNTSIAMLNSYLSKRVQYVFFKNSKSQISGVQHGVPQGSILGPVFFQICINDLANFRPDVGLMLFADDTTHCYELSSYRQPR